MDYSTDFPLAFQGRLPNCVKTVTKMRNAGSFINAGNKAYRHAENSNTKKLALFGPSWNKHLMEEFKVKPNSLQCTECNYIILYTVFHL